LNNNNNNPTPTLPTIPTTTRIIKIITITTWKTITTTQAQEELTEDRRTEKQTNKQTKKQTSRQETNQASNQHGWEYKCRVAESGGGLSAKTEQAHSTWDLCTFTASTSPDGHAGRSRPQAAKSLSQRRKGVRVTSTKALWGRGLNKSPRIIRLLTQRPTASSVSIGPAWGPVRAKLTGLPMPLVLGL
jgi:hypothetical protein